ncbi:MAG: aminotransferase class I/II-fold pyridoxal phosphate-dependent enzyme [Myxococcota bacterium]
MSELELDSVALREMVREVLDRLGPFLDRQQAGPMTTPVGGKKAARDLRRGWPESGTPFRSLLPLLDRALATSLDPTSPGYLAYVPGGGLPHAAVADLYADLVNRFTGLWMPAPGFVTLEVDVIRWFCAMVGYGDDAGGVLTSGGSLANLAGIVAARARTFPDGGFGAARVYRSHQAHHSVDKALSVAGFSRASRVDVPTDGSHRMDPRALDRAIRADRDAGNTPLVVVANAGSTAVGAVDDLSAAADVCAEHQVWLHVDAAYGGFFALTERGRAALRGLDRADSIALDPHKGLFLPYGTGCVLARRRADLRAAHAVEASYLPTPDDDPLAWDFADLGPELSRPFRGLRAWLPLMMHGFSAFRAALDEKLDLARTAAEAIRELPNVRMVSEPTLSLFAFSCEPPGLDLDAISRLNHRWLAAVNARRRVFLSGVTQDGRFVLRVCILSFRTHADRAEWLIEDLRATLSSVVGSAESLEPAPLDASDPTP